MELSITGKSLKAIQEKFGADKDLLGMNAYRYANRKDSDVISIGVDNLEVPFLEKILGVLKANDEVDFRRLQSRVRALQDPVNKVVTTLVDFPLMFEAYLKSFQGKYPTPTLVSTAEDKKGVGYAILGCSYTSGNNSYREDPRVRISLGFNNKMAFKVDEITLRKHDMRKSVPEILKKENLSVPDEDQLEEYEALMERFRRFSAQQGEQFYLRRYGWEATDDSPYWWRSEKVELTAKGKPSKGVLDFGDVKENRVKPTHYSDIYKKDVKIPTHPILRLFSLVRHVNVWVNVNNMLEYKYEEGLGSKLVLPRAHTHLIGALVANLETLRMESEAEDKSRTIRAKASSSIILAKGPAGTGKTLTAEIYAEEIHRPLYEVNSGQLGVSPKEIEENLEIVLDRATRLRMPLLINEADVFVQTRGRDLLQNAVCAVFLRHLEYHNGLVFLTTNRADDIDEAIRSRCIAEIAYGIPEEGERRELWRVLLKEFNVSLTDGEMNVIAETFPTVVGRDIQNLIRLTSRVCIGSVPPRKFGLRALRENAVFRSIEVANLIT